MVLALLFSAPLAHAFDYYVDAGGGISILSSTSAVLTDPTVGSYSGGTALGLQTGTFFGLNRVGRSFRIHLGLITHYASGSSSGATYSFNTLAPELRFTWGGIYFGLGATPFVWSRVRNDQGFDYFSKVKSALAYHTSIGYQLVITPEIAFIAGGGMHLVQASAGSPTWSDGMIGFRFFFGDLRATSGGPSEQNYDGYRYPGGWTTR